MSNYIESTQGICGGQPRISGRRITVFNVVARLYWEKSIATVMEDMELTMYEIKAAVSFCKSLECKNCLTFCSGCILRSIKDNDFVVNSNQVREIRLTGNETMVIDGNAIFLGSLSEFRDEKFGLPGWAISEEVEGYLEKNSF